MKKVFDFVLFYKDLGYSTFVWTNPVEEKAKPRMIQEGKGYCWRYRYGVQIEELVLKMGMQTSH